MKSLVRTAFPCLCAVVLFSLLSTLATDGRLSKSASAADYQTPLGKLDLKAGDTIVFLGDSITHQCLYTQYVEDYFYTRFPKMRLNFHNAGVGGARAWDALERFDRDVAFYNPKYVTILLGMNDGTYRPYDEPTFQTYHEDMTELIGKLAAIPTTPILMTPTMYDSRAARMNRREQPEARLDFYNSVLAYYGTWLREVALKNGYGFVDMWGPLNNLTLEQRKTDPDFTMIRDAVHPGAPGQVVMAVAMITDMGLPRGLSNIRISKAEKGPAVSRGQGGELTNLLYTADGVEFTWAAESLPWVVPEEAQLGAKLTKLGHRLSREALEVHDLPSGHYELSIGGTVVGTYHSTALERHIELQDNAKTPQYQQALAVAELNKLRNAGPVRNLRNYWSGFQRFSRARAAAKTEEDRAKLKELAEQFESMQEKITGMEAEARVIEDEIFEKNQPQPRKYVLRKVD